MSGAPLDLGTLPTRELAEMGAPYNPRRMSDAEADSLRRSLRRFGCVEPVIVNRRSGLIVGGHQRVIAAQAEGIETLPVAFVDLDDPGERQLNVALNRISGEWDDDKLRACLAEIESLGGELELTGFDDGELTRALAAAASGEAEEEDQDEELPEIPADPITEPGDVWELGPHRLICGNAADPETLAALMLSEDASLCFTSPPYGTQRNYEGATTDLVADWEALMRGVFSILPMALRGQVLVNLGLTHREGEVVTYWDGWLRAMRSEFGWRWFGWYVWDQGPGLPGSWVGRLAPSFEFLFHFNRESRMPNKIQPCGHAGELRSARSTDLRTRKGVNEPDPARTIAESKIPDSVIRITRQRGAIGKGIDHPAVFPIALPQYLIETYTRRGEIVFEPFAGSGSTVIAAQRAARRCRAVELVPGYVDVAVERFRRAFPDVAVARVAR